MGSCALHLGHLGRTCPTASEYTFIMGKLQRGQRISRSANQDASVADLSSFSCLSGAALAGLWHCEYPLILMSSFSGSIL